MSATSAPRSAAPRSTARSTAWLAWSSLVALTLGAVVYGRALLVELAARPTDDADASFILIGAAYYVALCLVLLGAVFLVAVIASSRYEPVHRTRLEWTAAVLTLLIGVAAFVIGLRSPDPALGRYSEQAHLLNVAALVITGLPLVVRLGLSPRSRRTGRPA